MLTLEKLDLQQEVNRAAAARQEAVEAEKGRSKALAEAKERAAWALLEDSLRSDFRDPARYAALGVEMFVSVVGRPECIFPFAGEKLGLYKDHPRYCLFWWSCSARKPFTVSLTQENLWEDLLRALSDFQQHLALLENLR